MANLIISTSNYLFPFCIIFLLQSIHILTFVPEKRKYAQGYVNESWENHLDYCMAYNLEIIVLNYYISTRWSNYIPPHPPWAQNILFIRDLPFSLVAKWFNGVLD